MGEQSEELIREYFPKYCAVVAAKLHLGAIEYGDKSFDMEAQDLIAEIQDELADVCGWSAVLWTKLEKLKKALA